MKALITCPAFGEWRRFALERWLLWLSLSRLRCRHRPGSSVHRLNFILKRVAMQYYQPGGTGLIEVHSVAGPCCRRHQVTAGSRNPPKVKGSLRRNSQGIGTLEELQGQPVRRDQSGG